MLAEELIAPSEKMTIEWVHVEVTRPVCDILNAFEESCFNSLDEFCKKVDMENFKSQLKQNIELSLEKLDGIKKLMDEIVESYPEDVDAIKEPLIMPFEEVFMQMVSFVRLAKEYIEVHNEIANKGYGFSENEHIRTINEMLREKLEEYKETRRKYFASIGESI